jgi:hypothetical protein
LTHPYRLDGERERERERLLSRERDLVCRDVLRGRERDREDTRRTTRVVLRSGEPRPRDRRTEPLLDRLNSTGFNLKEIQNKKAFHKQYFVVTKANGAGKNKGNVKTSDKKLANTTEMK